MLDIFENSETDFNSVFEETNREVSQKSDVGDRKWKCSKCSTSYLNKKGLKKHFSG